MEETNERIGRKKSYGAKQDTKERNNERRKEKENKERRKEKEKKNVKNRKSDS